MAKVSPVAIVGVLIVVAVVAAYVASVRKGSEAEAGKLIVSASFYPLAHFAERVGGDKVEVTNVTPAGSEPHDFEPTAKDVAKVEGSDVVIVNGNGLDPWSDKVKEDLLGKSVEVITMADKLDSLAGSEGEAKDPHFWLDPVNAQKEVEVIRDAFIKVDPNNADTYIANASLYLAQLNDLDRKFAVGLAVCAQREGITSHAAFGYLDKRYGITMTPIAGFSPDEEPSAQQIAKLSDLAKAKNIKYVFTETLVSSKLADTIATEARAKTIVFNPLEGLSDSEMATGKTYVSVMEENLTNLRTALNCQ